MTDHEAAASVTGHTEARDWLAAELRRHGLAPAVIRAVLGGADTYAARASAHAVAAERERIAELEQLAAGMLASFTRASDGYRARAGKVQIGKWEAVLGTDALARHPETRR